MAKMMVMIEIPNWDYEELVLAMEKKKSGEDPDCWFSAKDGDKVVVDEMYMTRAKCDDSFYAFELIGVRP